MNSTIKPLKFKILRLDKFFALESFERKLLVKTFLLLNLIRFSFLWVNLLTLRKLLAKLINLGLININAPDLSIQKIVWAVDVSTHFSPGGAKCLARALTAQVMMQQHGFDAQLQIGVINDPAKKFQAHAWLEHQGAVVIGQLPELSTYTTLLSPHTTIK
jgi:hypothetical protein